MTYVVFGAGGGIGSALAIGIIEAGYRPHLTVHTEQDVAAVEKKHIGSPLKPYVYSCDITNSREVRSTIESVIERSKSIDIVFNCTGILGEQVSISQTDIDDWNRVVSVNINGALYIMREVLPAMLRQKSGLIINLTSNRAKYFRIKGGAYNVTKFGLEALTNIADLECRMHGVRCIALNPGRVATLMRRLAAPDEDPSSITQPNDFAKYCVSISESLSYLKLPCSIDYDGMQS